MTAERLAVIRGTLEMRGRLPRDMAEELLAYIGELLRERSAAGFGLLKDKGEHHKWST